MAEKPVAPEKPKRTRAVKTIEVDKGTVKEKPVKKPAPKKVSPDKKESKEKAIPKKMTKEQTEEKIEQSKSLTNLIKELGEKNQPKGDAAVTKLAKDTIKLVGEAQRSGSLAFKREATKALVQIRATVDKMNFAKDDARAKLIADIDSVVLDNKNVTLYMKSLAKAQVDFMKAKAAEEIKHQKLKTVNESRLMKTEAKAQAKKITAQAQLEHEALLKKTEEEMKSKRAEEVMKIRMMRQDLADRAKKQKDDHALRDLAHKKTVDEEKEKIKQHRADSAIKVKQLRNDLIERKKKQDLETQLKRQEVKDQKERQKFELHEMKAHARVKLKELYQDIKDEHTARKRKDRDTRAKSFMKTVGSGIADANPVLALVGTVMRGIHDVATMRRDGKNNNPRQAKANRKLNKIFGPSSKIGPRSAGPSSNSGGQSGGQHAGNVQSTSGDDGKTGGFLTGILGLFSSIGGLATKVLPMLAGGLKAVPIVGAVITGVCAVMDFFEGFKNPEKIFGDTDITMGKKIFSGITNVVSSLMGMIDTVTGLFGFDTDLKSKVTESAKGIYDSIDGICTTFIDGAKLMIDSIIAPYRFMADKFADLLSKVPMFSDSAIVKGLKSFGSGSKGVFDKLSNDKPAASAAIKDKQSNVDDLKEKAEDKKAAGGNTTAVVDNSVKSNNTTVVNSKLSTRNHDPVVGKYGYGLTTGR